MSSRKAERSEATRSALVTAARALFAERGYAETGTEEIVQRAGVTRGALYHHFRDKRDLFRAVVEEMEGEVTQSIAAAAFAVTDPVEQLRAGSQAFLDACLDPAVQRIILQDGPSVLGLEGWREIEARYGFALLRGALQAAMEAGTIERQAVDALAHLLLGALSEAALTIVRAEDVASARAEVGTTLQRLLEGLRAQPPASSL